MRRGQGLTTAQHPHRQRVGILLLRGAPLWWRREVGSPPSLPGGLERHAPARVPAWRPGRRPLGGRRLFRTRQRDRHRVAGHTRRNSCSDIMRKLFWRSVQGEIHPVIRCAAAAFCPSKSGPCCVVMTSARRQSRPRYRHRRCRPFSARARIKLVQIAHVACRLGAADRRQPDPDHGHAPAFEHGDHLVDALFVKLAPFVDMKLVVGAIDRRSGGGWWRLFARCLGDRRVQPTARPPMAGAPSAAGPEVVPRAGGLSGRGRRRCPRRRRRWKAPRASGMRSLRPSMTTMALGLVGGQRLSFTTPATSRASRRASLVADQARIGGLIRRTTLILRRIGQGFLQARRRASGAVCGRRSPARFRSAAAPVKLARLSVPAAFSYRNTL